MHLNKSSTSGRNLSAEDFRSIETIGNVRLGKDHRQRIDMHIKPMLPLTAWDDRDYVQRRRTLVKRAARSLGSALRAIEAIVKLDTEYGVEVDEELTEPLSDVGEAKVLFEQESEPSPYRCRPPKGRLRDFLIEMFAIYQEADGKRWRVYRRKGEKGCEFTDFVWETCQVAGIRREESPYICKSKKALVRYWERYLPKIEEEAHDASIEQEPEAKQAASAEGI